MTQKVTMKGAGRLRKETSGPHPKSRLGPTKSDSMKASRHEQKTTGKDSLTPNDKLPLSPSPLQLPLSRSGDSETSLGQCRQFSHKIKLQLFPIDKVTQKGLEQDTYNPHLELNLKPEKKISSVVEHLNVKWGSSKSASGELILFPFDARPDNLANSRRWTLKDSEISAADVYASLGCPAKFRLRYGWFSNSELMAGKTAVTSDKSVEDLKPGRNFSKDNDEKKLQYPVSCQEKCPQPLVDSFCQGVASSSSLEKSVALKGNQNADNKNKFLWTNSLSNISFGAILSELSQTPSNLCCPVSTDSFDAAFAALVAQHQPIDESVQASRFSILEAEETRHPFAVTKIPSTQENASSSKDGLYIGNPEKVSSDSTNNALGPPAEAVSAYNAYQDLSTYVELQRKNNDAIERVASILPDSKGA